VSAQFAMDSAAGAPRRATAPLRAPLGRTVVLATLTALLVGCANAPPAPVSEADPSDPHAQVPAAAYRSTIAPYASQRPVDPAPWREQNERVAPTPRS
jgi:hypothetical protein